jgi:hypothetical protein
MSPRITAESRAKTGVPRPSPRQKKHQRPSLKVGWSGQAPLFSFWSGLAHVVPASRSLATALWGALARGLLRDSEPQLVPKVINNARNQQQLQHVPSFVSQSRGAPHDKSFPARTKNSGNGN